MVEQVNNQSAYPVCCPQERCLVLPFDHLRAARADDAFRQSAAPHQAMKLCALVLYPIFRAVSFSSHVTFWFNDQKAT
jgi:hypothetical protein